MMEILLYLSLHTINMGVLKKLAMLEMPTEATLVFRGLGCIFMAIYLAKKNNYSLVPNKTKLQLIRILIAGLGIGLMITSYKYVFATTVAVLFKFDVIFLIFFSLISLRKIKGLTLYALGAFILLLLHVLYFKEDTENLIGYGFALGGTFIISIGFILLSKSGKSENLAVTCIVPGISLVLGGIFLGFFKQGNYKVIPLVDVFIATFSGFIMFWIYMYTLKLYRKHSVVFTELLTFICIILFIPIEIWGLNTILNPQHILSILTIGLYTLFVYFKKERQYA